MANQPHETTPDTSSNAVVCDFILNNLDLEKLDLTKDQLETIINSNGLEIVSSNLSIERLNEILNGVAVPVQIDESKIDVFVKPGNLVLDSVLESLISQMTAAEKVHEVVESLTEPQSRFRVLEYASVEYELLSDEQKPLVDKVLIEFGANEDNESIVNIPDAKGTIVGSTLISKHLTQGMDDFFED